MNVNFGSGPRHIDGWTEYDSSLNIWLSKIPFAKEILFKSKILKSSHEIEWDPQIKKANIVKMKLHPGKISNAYLSHVLEHVYRSESQKILNNLYFGLKPGGLIRICSPDYDSFISQYQNSKVENELLAANLFEESLLSYPEVRPTGIEKIRRFFGGHIHYWHPFKSQIIEQLQVAGFIDITEHKFRSGNLFGIEDVENRSDDSFYLEARKKFID